MLWNALNWRWPFGSAAQDPDEDAAEEAEKDLLPIAFAVDDEEAITKFIVRVMASLGIETMSFRSAGAAIAALKTRMPAIIFLDVALEGSDAVDVIRGLGENGYCGVVQLMSGSDLSLLNDVRRVGERHRLNMRPPLEKPFRLEALRQVVKAANLEGRQTICVNLDEALSSGWLELWYQPKIDLRTRMLAGAEGLVRCRHPSGKLLLPENFLPGAGDDSHLALTEFVMLTALKDWNDVAAAGAPLLISLNTTVRSLERLPLSSIIRENRPANDRWPGLILEVTETDVVKDVALAHEIATQLRIYNINLAIDDFGEGYSSFTRLKGLPFSELKLDQNFVLGCATDQKNAGICKAVIELAHHFGTTAVAEGIENAPDLRAIHSMGCDIGQGYLLAPPMPKEDFVALLEKRAGDPGTKAPSMVPAQGEGAAGKPPGKPPQKSTEKLIEKLTEKADTKRVAGR
jgi:EAL domain-containing protein (putative c-di-GMP-specific phosphodiesterase class I)/CheY-like chemotaxis protein